MVSYSKIRAEQYYCFKHYRDKIIVIMIIFWLITMVIKGHVINNRVYVIRNGVSTQ